MGGVPDPQVILFESSFLYRFGKIEVTLPEFLGSLTLHLAENWLRLPCGIPLKLH